MFSLGARASAHKTGLREKLDRYMKASVKVDHFMGTVLVARDGKVLLIKGYGMADLKDHVPNRPDTEFRIGSVTKQFTAMGILMLQAEGKLNVHDRICKYVPDCPGDWKPITIFQLLTHTSGIPNFTSFPNYLTLMSKPTTPTQLLADFRDKPLDFKPGTRFKYSNSGYVVLGYIIRQVSGEAYKHFLQQHVFGPLDMRNSGYDSSHPTAKNHAEGYEYDDGHYRPAPYVNMTVPYSAGALYSTVRNLYAWDRALESGKLLPEALHQQMFAPQVPVGGEIGKILGDDGSVHYGFGWFISKEFGHRQYSHEGGIQGFTSLNSWFPRQHAYVIVLDNVTSPHIFTIGRSLAAILFDQKYTLPAEPRAIHLPVGELQKFVGAYRLAPNFTITITRKGDQLIAQATSQPAAPIFPRSKTGFFYKIVDAQISFVSNAKGRVTGLVLHQNGQDMPGRRVNPKSIEKDGRTHKTVKLTKMQLQRFVGTYQLAPGFSIVIEREGDQLKEQATGQPALPIYPESKTEFFLKVVDAQISFVTNGQGIVTGLVLHQNGRDLAGKKVH